MILSDVRVHHGQRYREKMAVIAVNVDFHTAH